ncbi:MAG: GAF domain-containing protein [Chloroflexaceae bacterium]|nr:GAF domain-containing protein [Chloroflexaceae bacterium]
MNDTDHIIAALQRQLDHERAQRQHAESVLHESQRLLAGLMHNLPGMAYRCRINSQWTMEFVSGGSLPLTGYAPDDLIGNRRVAYGSLIHPDDRDHVQQTVYTALQAQQPFEVTYRLMTACGVEKWVWEQGRRVERTSGNSDALEGFITDMSQRVLAHQQLEQRVGERTRQLTTLLEVQRTLSSRLDPDAVMQMIAEEARQLIGVSFSALFVREDETLRVAALAGRYGPDMMVGYCMPLRDSATGLALLSGQVVCIDSLDDPRIYRKAMEAAHIESMLGIPLLLGDTPIGVISVGASHPHAFRADDEAMLALLALVQQLRWKTPVCMPRHSKRQHLKNANALRVTCMMRSRKPFFRPV